MKVPLIPSQSSLDVTTAFVEMQKFYKKKFWKLTAHVLTNFYHLYWYQNWSSTQLYRCLIMD